MNCFCKYQPVENCVFINRSFPNVFSHTLAAFSDAHARVLHLQQLKFYSDIVETSSESFELFSDYSRLFGELDFFSSKTKRNSKWKTSKLVKFSMRIKLNKILIRN